MDKKQEKFMQELLADFNIEAAEHLQLFTNGLIELEKNKEPEVTVKVIETIFREIHSAKGAARAVNLVEIERVCQSLESALASLKAGRLRVSPPLFDILHEAGDMIGVMLRDVLSGSKSYKGEDTMKMVCKLSDLAEGKLMPQRHNVESEDDLKPGKKVPDINKPVPEYTAGALPESVNMQDTVRISVEKLTSVMIQAEEFVAAKSMFRYFSKDLEKINTMYFALWKQTEIKLKEMYHESGQDSLGSDDFRKWQHETSRELYEHISRLNRLLGHYEHSTSRMIDEMLLSIRKTLLIPFSTVLDIFPKMVRDLARDSGKEIRINIQGGTIEIDRRILEEIKDPLIHLVRNCIDHGIEKPEERVKLGKPRHGDIEIKIFRTQNKEIGIEISDDGGGINPGKVKISAINEGRVSSEAAQALSDLELLQLVFQSGVTTSPLITDISGRGLGLAIVLEKIIRLGGTVSVSSDLGKGTCFTLILPLTLATFRGVLIRLGENFVIVPLSNVEKAVRINKSQIHSVENKATIVYEDHHIPLFNMCDALGFVSGKSKSPDKYVYTIILSSGKKKIGFQVDEVVGEKEGIIKPLGGQLLNVRHLIGATLLGNGKVVPVVDAFELLETVLTTEFGSSHALPETPESAPASGARIMVAEDSLTSRSLLRNLLEAAGYEVNTAVDGWEAYTILKQGGFDLVVSDIEMPRMNGFELTAKIRTEPELASLPVVLVTALESAEDRQRGLEAGANAYIVKSSFEGSNLVSTIQRLI